jgi:4-hydroxy-tetrahydrodipicolinate reductase
MNPVKVILWGLGSMGSLAARMLDEKEGVEIVGAVDSHPAKSGRSLGELFGLKRFPDVAVTGDSASTLKTEADVALLAVSSFIRDTEEHVRAIVESGKNVVTIAEEWASPWRTAPEAARRIDELAKAHGVTVLGTGVNPGFVLDTLIIALTGVCRDVRRIRARRVNDLSPFGPTVMETQGVGRSIEEFRAGRKDGSIVGHIGFVQSVSMIASSLGLELDEITESVEPIVSRTHRRTEYVEVLPGQVAGCSHRAEGWSGGEIRIVLEHPQQVRPDLEGVATGDFIEIEGSPDIKMNIVPEIPGGLATAAIAVNMIPEVLNARSGVITMPELPVPAARLSDFRSFLRC